MAGRGAGTLALYVAGALAYDSDNEMGHDPPTHMNNLNTRLLRSITEMLGAQNGHAPESYGWVWERWGKASTAELVQMQAGWQKSQPELFRAHGIYVL